MDANFHGWWRNKSIGAMNAFNAGGPNGAVQDQYIFIDTSSYPIKIFTTFGTNKYPSLTLIGDNRPSEIPPVYNFGRLITEGNLYFYFNDRELVNGYSTLFKGRVDPILSVIQNNTIKLLKNGDISVFKYLNYNYQGQVQAGLCIYEKMKEKCFDFLLAKTQRIDWNNPINLFKYYASVNEFSNVSTNNHVNANNYIGKKRSKKILNQFIKGNFVKTTELKKIRVTNTKYYSDILIPSDTWTTVYTNKYSYVTPGSNVEIKGANGKFSILNGKYKNGIGLLNSGANLLLKEGFVIKEPYSFLLDLNSSCLKDLSKSNGFINLPSGITITVKHKLNTYNEFCASCAAYFYKVFSTGTHVDRSIYTEKGSCKLVTSFPKNLDPSSSEYQELNTNFEDSVRLGQPFVSWYYHNFYDYRNEISGVGIEKTGGLQNMVNNPYPVNYYNPLFQYDVAIGNYLINVHNLVFTIRGTLQKDQPDPIIFNYPLIPDKGRAHFEGFIYPSKIKNGVIQSDVPINYKSMGPYNDDKLNLNSHYFGQINPNLTNGKIIGYLYKRDCKFLDPSGLMTKGVYTSERPNESSNPRIFRESLSRVYSKMMKWFNSINCESIIIDQTGNLGGDPDLLSILEFIGSDRQAYFTYNVPKDPDEFPLNYLNSKTVANAGKNIQSSQYLYVSLNKKLYPKSVFKGNKVVFMTDIFSRSAGDHSPNYFIDRNLGNGVESAIIGCLDGREFGFISVNNSFPSAFPSPFKFNIDYGGYFLRYTDEKLSMLKQNEKIKPDVLLPISFEKTVFKDFGFLTSPCKEKKRNPKNPKTWTYLYLDKAIKYLVKNEK